MAVLSRAALVAVVLVLAFAAYASACGSWTKYTQCDSAWGNDRLGTSSQTICQAGCAMSSVAMALTTKGKDYNPDTLNNYLNGHGGYVDGDLIVWSAVDALGVMSFLSEGSLSTSDVKKYVDACYPIIANVRDGTHWVLVTAISSDGKTLTVNDPGFPGDTYSWTDVSDWVVYKS